MLHKLLAPIILWMTAVMAATGPLGVTLLMGIESACIPLPSEVIMPFAGYLAYKGQMSFLGLGTSPWAQILTAGLFGAIGCNLRSVIAYWIGAKGGRPLVERYGKWVLMNRHDLDRMTYFFTKYGAVTVLLGRLLPVVRTFIAFPAGIARMPQLRFHIYTFLGSWPWCFTLAYAGMKLGERWHTDPRFEQAFHRFHLVVEIALVAAIVWFVWTHFKRSRETDPA